MAEQIPLNAVSVTREDDDHASLSIHIRAGDAQLEELLRLFFKGARNYDTVYQAMAAADTDRTNEIAATIARASADMSDHDAVTVPVLDVLNAIQAQLVSIPK